MNSAPPGSVALRHANCSSRLRQDTSAGSRHLPSLGPSPARGHHMVAFDAALLISLFAFVAGYVGGRVVGSPGTAGHPAAQDSTTATGLWASRG